MWQVTARSAVDLIDIHPNMAAFFYKKIRLVIVSHLELEAQDVCDGQWIFAKLFWRKT